MKEKVIVIGSRTNHYEVDICEDIKNDDSVFLIELKDSFENIESIIQSNETYSIVVGYLPYPGDIIKVMIRLMHHNLNNKSKLNKIYLGEGKILTMDKNIWNGFNEILSKDEEFMQLFNNKFEE